MFFMVQITHKDTDKCVSTNKKENNAVVTYENDAVIRWQS
jgi:hypothetical protein